MNIKNLWLISALVSIVITDPIIAVTNKSEKTKSAPSIVMTFKNDIQCLLSRSQTCTTAQKKRLIKQSLIAIALAGGTILGVTKGIPVFKRQLWAKKLIDPSGNIADKKTICRFINALGDIGGPLEDTLAFRPAKMDFEISRKSDTLDQLTSFYRNEPNMAQYLAQDKYFVLQTSLEEKQFIFDVASVLDSFGIFEPVERAVNEQKGYVYLLATLK